MPMSMSQKVREEMLPRLRQRYANRGNGADGVGSEADAAFDAAYDVVLVEADAVEQAVHADMLEGLEKLRGAQTFAMATLVFAGFGAASGCFAVFLLFRKVVAARLQQLVGITSELAKGNTEIEIPAQKAEDELTVMYDAFGKFRDAAGSKRR